MRSQSIQLPMTTLEAPGLKLETNVTEKCAGVECVSVCSGEDERSSSDTELPEAAASEENPGWPAV